MGTSAPPSAPFDLVNSWARRRGPSVEIVLNGAEVEAPETLTEAVLRRGRTRVVAQVAHDEAAFGRRIIVTVARADLDDGAWVLRLRGGSREPVATRTRLLVQGERPLVLLWGEEEQGTRLPEPHPRTPTPPVSTAASDVRRAVVRGASRALDVVLAPLPEQRRRGARSGARRLARRVLG